MSYHKSLNEYSDNALYAHNKNCFRTLFIRRPGAVSDGMLRFNREEEATGKRVDVIKAGDKGFGRICRRSEIAVGKDNKPPNEGK